MENNQEAKPTKNRSIATILSLGKDSVTLLRDAVLFLLALLLLFFPGTFNSVLSSAGFEEGSFVGFKWKPTLLKTDAALVQANGTINELKDQNSKLTKLLTEAQAKLNDPALKEELNKLEDKNKQIAAASAQVEASVASTLEDNAKLVSQVQTSADAKVKWGVVYSGDSNMKDASTEVGPTVAGNLGIPNAKIYLRQGAYRGVSVVDSRTDAQQVLQKAKQRRSDAYIVNMSTWCPNSNQKDGFIECVGQ